LPKPIPMPKVLLLRNNGKAILEMANYDNVNKTFDGRAGNMRKLQPAGTYFTSFYIKRPMAAKSKKSDSLS
jgi:hypothetical protein